jgi:putative hemolysin
MYENSESYAELGFARRALKKLNVSYSLHEGAIENIPTEGPVVIVSNHPFGGLEGIILLDLLSQVRSKPKLLANYMLSRVPDVQEHFVFVDPFGQENSKTKNIGPMREAIRFLQGGNVIGVFPSGTVSHFQWRKRVVSDPAWNVDIARIIKTSGATVVPVFFEGQNGILFQLAGLIHPLFRTALIPRELANKRDMNVEVKIGSPIPPEKLQSFQTEKEMTAYLRLRTYIMKGSECKNLKRAAKKADVRELEPIAQSVSAETLANEVASLPKEQLLTQSSHYDVYYAEAGQIPHLLREIGIQREIAFRAVSEGSGKSIDLDRFDNYYTHLFLWNPSKSELVGAYRLAKADKVVARHGINGLYTSTLFAYRSQLLDQIGPCLELGRSFVCLNYQRHYSSLNLLWRGIAEYVIRYPKYKILFGTVSISNDYDTLSRRLITHFLKENLFLPELAKLLKPKNPACSKPLREIEAETSVVVKGLNEISELVAEIEAHEKSIPVLLRQYLRLGGKLLGFNIDKDFGNVLDGLIYIDLTETNRTLLNRYFGKEGSEKFLAHYKENPVIPNSCA